jgi:glycosyltransferase involved in cell wall biosynthesis
LVRYGLAPADKIVVAYNGADHAARWDAQRSQIILGPRPYVLCLGQPQRYKNMELVLKMAPSLAALGIDIYMAGGIKEEALPLGEGVRPANLRLLGRVSDDDLARLLEGAICFLFPSRIEGFGLPAVEAMTHGCPVIASTAPCLPEICGEGAVLADPDRPDEWVQAVRLLWQDDQQRRRMIENGRRRAAKYSWRAIAETYLTLMTRVDAGC